MTVLPSKPTRLPFWVLDFTTGRPPDPTDEGPVYRTFISSPQSSGYEVNLTRTDLLRIPECRCEKIRTLALDLLWESHRHQLLEPTQLLYQFTDTTSSTSRAVRPARFRRRSFYDGTHLSSHHTFLFHPTLHDLQFWVDSSDRTMTYPCEYRTQRERCIRTRQAQWAEAGSYRQMWNSVGCTLSSIASCTWTGVSCMCRRLTALITCCPTSSNSSRRGTPTSCLCTSDSRSCARFTTPFAIVGQS